MGAKFDKLQAHLAEVHNLAMAYGLLFWDQNTHMPPEGAKARAATQATLWRARHEMLTSDKTARLLDEAEQEVDMDDFDSDAASLIRVARRDYDYDSQLPADFVADFALATTNGMEVWKRAKSE